MSFTRNKEWVMEFRTIVRLLSITMVSCSLIHANLIQISDAQEYKDLVKNNNKVLVKFSADWCSVCNGIKKPFQEVCCEPEFNKIAFANINVDEHDGLAKEHGVVGVPTIVYFENGNKKLEEIGVQNMPEFKEHLRKNLRSTFQIAQNEPVDSITNSEEIIIDESLPVEAAPEPNVFIKIAAAVKNFVVMIFVKIKQFFVTIFDAIKGFFGK